MSGKEYNGWSNYETWAVNLWLTNDEGSNRQLERMARRADDTSDLAQSIKAWVEEMMPELDNGLAADLLNAALGEVDWYEIAKDLKPETSEGD